MKNFLLISLCTLSCSVSSAQEIYVADTKASNVHWLGKKTTGQHEGDVKLQSGKLNFKGSTPVSGVFIIDMNSISVTDIKDADDNKNLVDHLKEGDFLGTTENPTAVLSIKKFEVLKRDKTDAPNYTAIADLTIKGIKKEIHFPVSMDTNKGKTITNANIIIDRTKWNIVYKSKSILGSTADKFIYDDITFSVNLILQKQK